MSFCSWAKQEIYRDNFSPGDYVCRFVEKKTFNMVRIFSTYYLIEMLRLVLTLYLSASATTPFSPGIKPPEKLVSHIIHRMY